jgi:hypothetical protein
MRGYTQPTCVNLEPVTRAQERLVMEPKPHATDPRPARAVCTEDL